MKASNKKKKTISTLPTSRRSTEETSQEPSAKKLKASEEKPKSKRQPQSKVASTPPETVYNVVQIDLVTSETVVLTFQSVHDLGQHLSELVNKDYQVFVFEGQRCFTTKGPFHYLKLPDGSAIPLFRAPNFQEMEVDETGIMCEQPDAPDVYREEDDPEYDNSDEELEPNEFLHSDDSYEGGWPYPSLSNAGDPLESDNFGDIEDTGHKTEEEEEFLDSEPDEELDWRDPEDRGDAPQE
jgi:hypothetical protein